MAESKTRTLEATIAKPSALGLATIHLSAGGATLAAFLISGVYMIVASALLVAAFVLEPVAGGYPTNASRFGLFSLFLGSAFHFGAGLRLRRDT